MTRFVLRRTATSLIVLLGISFLLFLSLHLLPGDPAELMLDPFTPQGDRAAAIERLRNDMGLNRPLIVQYVRWLIDLLQGNLGYSYTDGRPVTEVITSRLGPTIWLMAAALTVGLVVGITLGLIAAVKRNTWVDYASTLFSMVSISVPSFFTAVVGIYVFAVKLRWFPTGGMRTSGAPETWTDFLHHLVLPALVLGLATAGPYARYVRAGLVDVLGQPYIVTARSKGLSGRRVLLGHGLRSALIPLISVVAIQVPQLVAGAVVIEQVFAWPGMGRLALDAILNRNYPVVLAFVMTIAVLVVVCNLLADIVYSLVDPRIRIAGAA